MDLKSKGRAWVGKICQRFETLCQQVDVVNQDAIKYVENQVQTVGESVKKICSDVVQIVDPVRCEAQAVALKGNAVVTTYVKSIIGTEENNGQKVFNRQSCFEPSDLSKRNAFDGFDFVYQPTVVSHESLHMPEFEQDRNIDNVSTNENYNLSMEENAREKYSAPDVLESIASHENDLTSALLSHELINNDTDIECVSLDEDAASTLVDDQDALPSQEVEIVHCNSTDVSDSLSGISTAVGLSEITFSFGSSRGSVIFTEPCALAKNSLNDIQTKIEPVAEAINVVAHVSDPSSSLVSSISAPILSSNKEEEETRLTFYNSVTLMEPTDRFISLSSSVSTPIDCCSKGEAETRVCSCNSVMSPESTVCSAYAVDSVADSGMETIDLFDKSEVEESCVIVDNSMLFEVVRRIHWQRSFKKKIQDAFNTRKRLTKEYEQLAIWCGDLDTESSEDTVRQMLPFSNAVTLDPDSEWELL